jgi:predicted PurR-regulated permease PerM
VGNLIDRFGSSANTLYSIVSSTFSGVFTVFTIMVMSFYLMLDRRNLHLRIAWFTQRKEHLEQAKDFIDSLEYQLGGWVRGQIILMLVIGILTYIGLLLLGLPYALPLALLAASLEILPNLGPTLAAVPAVVIAYITAGPLMGLITLLFYILVQQFENNLLVPKIMKDNVDVSPLISIVSILIGLKLAGVIGALLAIPIYIILRTIYSTWVKDHLID